MAAMPPALPPDPPACYGTVTHGEITHPVELSTHETVTFMTAASGTGDWILVLDEDGDPVYCSPLYYDDDDPEDEDLEAILGWPFCFWWPSEVNTLSGPEEVGPGSVAKARLRYPVGEDNLWGGGT